MSTKIKRNLNALKHLSQAKPATVCAIIKSGEKELINSLCECCLNVLKGNVHLSPSQHKRLIKYKATIRSLAKKKTSDKKKRALLQKGGFLGALLPTVLTALGTLIS